MSTKTMKKTAYIRTRIRPDIKRDAERVFHKLGMSTTDAVSVFFSQVAMQRGLPFHTKIPNKETIAAFDEDLSKAKKYSDVDEMFDDILGKDWKDD